MKRLKDLLNPKRFPPPDSLKPLFLNPKFEAAREFGEYVGIEPILVLHLFKRFGQSEVLALRSWLRDYPQVREKMGKFKLAVWKLKQGQKKEK